MSVLEVKLVVHANQLAALGTFLQTLEGNAAPVVDVAHAATTQPAVKETAEAEKPKRTRRATTAKVEPVEAEPTQPEVDDKPSLDYLTDVKPALVKLASHKNGGNEAAKALVKSFGVKSAQEIPADKLQDLLDRATEAFATCEAAVSEDDDDVSFE